MCIAPLRSTRTLLIAAWCLTAPAVCGVAFAQSRPSPAVDFSVGWVGFADDGIVSETAVGGDARFYLTPRIAVGPELLYIGGDNHSHLVLTGNVVFDLFAPSGGRPARITPFLVAGGGMFQTRESFFGEDTTNTEGAFTAGGGVRAAVSDRVTVGMDARIGWESHIRLGGSVGVRLGR